MDTKAESRQWHISGINHNCSGGSSLEDSKFDS